MMHYRDVIVSLNGDSCDLSISSWQEGCDKLRILLAVNATSVSRGEAARAATDMLLVEMAALLRGDDTEEVFEIQTSCGQVFRMTADEMTLTQLHGLIDGNPDNPATEQLRAELERRKGAVPSAAALAA